MRCKRSALIWSGTVSEKQNPRDPMGSATCMYKHTRAAPKAPGDVPRPRGVIICTSSSTVMRSSPLLRITSARTKVQGGRVTSLRTEGLNQTHVPWKVESCQHFARTFTVLPEIVPPPALDELGPQHLLETAQRIDKVCLQVRIGDAFTRHKETLDSLLLLSRFNQLLHDRRAHLNVEEASSRQCYSVSESRLVHQVRRVCGAGENWSRTASSLRLRSS